MPGPKNQGSVGHKLATAARRERIEALRRQGIMTSRKIAEALRNEGINISYKTIQRDVTEIAKELLGRAVDYRLAAVHEAQWRQDQLAGEWERSKNDRERAKVQRTTANGGEDAEAKTVEEQLTEGRIAEVACLREHRENAQEIAKLVGAYPPAQHDVKLTEDIDPDLAGKTADDIRALLLLRRRVAQSGPEADQ